MNPFMTGKLFHDSLIQFEGQFLFYYLFFVHYLLLLPAVSSCTQISFLDLFIKWLSG
jgi:hypothetical protein